MNRTISCKGTIENGFEAAFAGQMIIHKREKIDTGSYHYHFSHRSPPFHIDIHPWATQKPTHYEMVVSLIYKISDAALSWKMLGSHFCFFFVAFVGGSREQPKRGVGLTPERRCLSLSSSSRKRTNFLSILSQVFTSLVFGWRFRVVVHSVTRARACMVAE